MIRTFVAVGIVATTLLSFGAAARAEDFYAAPLNSGPPTSSVPLINGTLGVVNAVTSPILQPILAPGGGPAPLTDAPVTHHHHHHHHHKK